MKAYLIIFLFILIVFGGCEPFFEKKHYITVLNNSEQEISIFAGYFNDTILPESVPNFKVAKSGSFVDIHDSEVDDFKFERLKTEKITVYILDSDTVQMKSWSDLRKEYNILMRYNFNKKELVEMGGKLNFPPASPEL